MELADEQILYELIKDAKANMPKLSRTLGIPVSTLYAKIKRMEKEGIIKNYSISIDWKKLGYAVRAVVLVYIDTRRLNELKKSHLELMEKLRTLPNVDSVILVTGDADIVVNIRARDNEHLGKILTEEIASIDGVSETRTLVCIQ